MQSLGEFQNTLVNSAKDHDDDSSFWDDAADSIAGLGEWIGGLWNDLTGLSAQQNEFAQQEYLQDKMNEYNLPVNQMARLRAAGINPNTAAVGIAKAGSESAQAPAVNTNTQGVQGAVNTLANGLNSLSNARKLFKEGNVVEPLAKNMIDLGSGQIERWSHENGLTDAETQGLLIDNETRSDMNRADLNIKIQQHENMKKQGDLIQGQKDYLERQIAWYDEQISAEIDLTKKRALEAEKNAFFLEERTKTEQMENDFAERFHYRRDQPFDTAMLSLWFNGDYEKAIKAEEFMFDLKYGESYNIAKGQFNSDPYQEESRELYDYRNQLLDYRAQLRETYTELNKAMLTGKISKDNYSKADELRERLRKNLEKINRDIDEADDSFKSQAYLHGYHSELEDILQQAIPFGLGFMFSRGRRPVRVKGYSNY